MLSLKLLLCVLLGLLPGVKGRRQLSVCLHPFLGWLLIGDPVTKIHNHILTVPHQSALSNSAKRGQRKRNTYMNVDVTEREDKRETKDEKCHMKLVD